MHEIRLTGSHILKTVIQTKVMIAIPCPKAFIRLRTKHTLIDQILSSSLIFKHWYQPHNQLLDVTK